MVIVAIAVGMVSRVVVMARTMLVVADSIYNNVAAIVVTMVRLVDTSTHNRKQ